MSVNVEMMENKVQQSFSPVDKIQTNLTEGKTQNWVPENEANKYIKTKSFSTSENGEYVAKDEGADAFSEVKINVASPAYHLVNKQITQNGTYSASAEGADAFSEVKVDVEAPDAKGGDYTLAWSKVSSTGLNATFSMVEYSGALYMYDSNGTFRSFNGSSWTTLQSLPVTGYACLVVHNNQIHAFNKTAQYVWNGSSWTASPVQNPANFTNNTIVAISHQGQIHVIYGYNHWSFNGMAWTEQTRLTETLSNGRCAYELEGKMHILTNGNDYVYENNAFQKVATWKTGIYSVGRFQTFEINKVLGNGYVQNGVMQMLSYNGRFVRWEENPERSVRALNGSVGSINNVLYLIGQSAVYQATIVQQEE